MVASPAGNSGVAVVKSDVLSKLVEGTKERVSRMLLAYICRDMATLPLTAWRQAGVSDSAAVSWLILVVLTCVWISVVLTVVLFIVVLTSV